jgi:hypothetical protein
METQTKLSTTTAKVNPFSRFFKKLADRISELFEPEEVEVEFKVEGDKVSYTYTKVPHKQAA